METMHKYTKTLAVVGTALRETLDLTLETSALKLYSQEDWTTFQERRGYTGIAGTFKPRSMTAHVLDDGNFHNLLHEHIGHRTYFEKSKVGVDIRRREDGLYQLESIIIPGYEELPEDTALVFQQGDVDDYEVEFNGDVKVVYSSSSPLVREYLLSSDQLRSIRIRFLLVAENFAEWMAGYVCRQLGLEDVSVENQFHLLEKERDAKVILENI